MNEVYQSMRAPLAPEKLTRDDLLHLVAHLNQAHRISERMFKQHDRMVVRVPSAKYLAVIAKLLGTRVHRLETWGHHVLMSVKYNGVEFNTYEPEDGPWVDDRR